MKVVLKDNLKHALFEFQNLSLEACWQAGTSRGRGKWVNLPVNSLFKGDTRQF